MSMIYCYDSLILLLCQALFYIFTIKFTVIKKKVDFLMIVCKKIIILLILRITSLKIEHVYYKGYRCYRNYETLKTCDL